MTKLTAMTLFDRVIDAGTGGRALSAAELLALGGAFERMADRGLSFESALKLPRNWRASWRRREVAAAVRLLKWQGESNNVAAKRIAGELAKASQSRPAKPDGRAALLAHALNMNGSVPAVSTLRRHLAGAPGVVRGRWSNDRDGRPSRTYDGNGTFLATLAQEARMAARVARRAAAER